MITRAFFTGLILYFSFLFIKNKFLDGYIYDSKHSINKNYWTWNDRQNEVRQAFIDSWKGYEKYAWGFDVYHPLSKTGENMGPEPLGWIIVESLDTLMIMDLQDELHEARDFVMDLDYDMDYNVNTFETTIRILGGFLSAYYLSNDELYLQRAIDLGDRLISAFDSQTGIAYSTVNLRLKEGIRSYFDQGASSTAEASTIQLEFKWLAKLTGNDTYWKKGEKIFEQIDKNHTPSGLVPIFIQPDTGLFQGHNIRWGSRGDSYYEYLIKQYFQTKQQEPVYLDIYKEALHGLKTKLLKKSYPSKLQFIGELPSGVDGKFSNKMDHLVCFAGSIFALGSTDGATITDARKSPFWTVEREQDLKLAKSITKTCYELYAQTESGLAPEIVVFNTNPNDKKADLTKDFIIKYNDRHNLQRPETVESLFYLWRITKDPIYREWGWNIFTAFQNQSKVEGDAGYACLKDVTQNPAIQADNMESFWLSETLKYLYLLFDDNEDLLPLSDVVFSTEAHPFPKFDISPFKTGWSRSKQ